jgi:type II secretory pathway component HofQ
MLRRRLFVAVVIGIASAGIAAAAAAQEMRIYAVQHRTADELAPVVASAVEGEARVIADRRTNSIVLSGSPRGVASALQLLATLDVRPHTVRLRYEARTSGELTSGGVSVSWRAASGSFRVADVHWPSGAAALAVGAESETTRRTEAFAGELRILEGQSGQIASGASLPITTRRIQRSGVGEVVDEETRYVTAQSGFEASPRVLRDGRVELALRPFQESMRSDGAVAHAGADTVLVLTPGATVALGGIVREESARRGGLSGADASGAGQESLLLVTVEVE